MLALRRVLLRLYALLKTHLAEEELHIPILEDRLTPAHEAALARALDHLAAERLWRCTGLRRTCSRRESQPRATGVPSARLMGDLPE